MLPQSSGNHSLAEFADLVQQAYRSIRRRRSRRSALITEQDQPTCSIAAAATRGGDDGSDVARSDGTKTGPVDKQANMKNAKPIHSQEEEGVAYLRRKVRLLEREVSRLRETVERLTKERAGRAAEGRKNDSEGQKGDHLYEGDERKCPPGPQRERLWGRLPHLPHTSGQHRAAPAVPTGWGVAQITRKRTNSDSVAQDLEIR